VSLWGDKSRQFDGCEQFNGHLNSFRINKYGNGAPIAGMRFVVAKVDASRNLTVGFLSPT
jgi:hypothetical protein